MQEHVEHMTKVATNHTRPSAEEFILQIKGACDKITLKSTIFNLNVLILAESIFRHKRKELAYRVHESLIRRFIDVSIH